MASHQIIFSVKNSPISNSQIIKVVDDQLKRRNFKGKTVEVEVVGLSKIKSLNKKFLGKSGATDVLSFPLKKIPGEKNERIGTIVICNDIIKSQAKCNGLSFEGEFSKMLRHGVDHLLGFHHK